MRSRFRRFIAPALAGFLVCTAVLLSLSHKDDQSFVAHRRNLINPPIKSLPESKTTPTADNKTANPPKPLTPVEKFIQTESQRVGRPDNDPERSFAHLKAIASKLRRLDMNTLKNMAVNQSLNNDQRFLSAYLLSLTPAPEAAGFLREIALFPLNNTDVSSTLYAEELAIRTQALEGLARFHSASNPLLFDYLKNQNNSFLSDQAKRLLKERKREKRQ